MKQIPYNSTYPLYIEFPAEWDGKLISGLTLGVKNTAGVELLTHSAVSLYPQAALEANAARYADTIILAAGAAALAPGDAILLCGIAGDEVHRVKAYDSTTRTVILESILNNAHDAGEVVHGLFGTYTIDTTATDKYTLTLLVALTWTPAGSGQTITGMARISKSVLDIAGMRTRFKAVYPRAYDVFTSPVDKFIVMLEEAERQVEQALLANLLDIQRIVDQDMISSAIMARMAWLWVLNSDDDMEVERKVIASEYERQIGIVTKLPIWTDDNQDGIKDPDSGEVTDHEHVFGRGW